MNSSEKQLKQQLKRWAEAQQPPREGRVRLLQAAMETQSEQKERLYSVRYIRSRDEFEWRKKFENLRTDILSSFCLGFFNPRLVL